MKTLVPMRAASFRPERPEQLGAFLAKPDCDFEIKLDGVRIIADCRTKGPALWYRSGQSADFRELMDPLAAFPGCVFDGEVVAFDEVGRPSFATLAPRLHMRRGRRGGGKSRGNEAVCYLVFDLLMAAGEDLTALPLSERRTRLEAIGLDSPLVRVHPALQDGMALLEFAKTHALEGIVRKDRNSRYVYGPKANDGWQKLKFEQEDDFVVTGYLMNGKRLVSLEISSFSGNRLVMRARVGSGLSEVVTNFLLAELARCPSVTNIAEGELPPFDRNDERRYVEPKIVVSVRYLEWTPDGHLRMPVFRGVRLDAASAECVAEPPTAPR